MESRVQNLWKHRSLLHGFFNGGNLKDIKYNNPKEELECTILP